MTERSDAEAKRDGGGEGSVEDEVIGEESLVVEIGKVVVRSNESQDT